MSETEVTRQKTIIEEAIGCIKSVRDLDDKIKEVGRHYRARTRRMASMVYETGLLSTICYLYSKATKDVYDKFVKAQVSEKEVNVEALKSAGADKVANAVYLYHILSYIANNLGQAGQEKDPIYFVKMLAENPVKLGVVESLLRPFLIELKHLAEAVLEPEES